MSASPEPHLEVDFRRRDTEAGWQGTLDRFGLAAGPVWFEWLEWILVLGAFEYLALKSHFWVARAVVVVSVGLLWFYFNGFFYRIHFKGWFRIQSPWIERVISLVASGILATVFWFAAQATAYVIAANTK